MINNATRLQKEGQQKLKHEHHQVEEQKHKLDDDDATSLQKESCEDSHENVHFAVKNKFTIPTYWVPKEREM